MASRYKIAPEADVVLLSFPMHFTWEFLQAPLFKSMEPLSHFDGIRVCLQATLGDLALVLVAFWATGIVTGTRRWHVRPDARAIAVCLVPIPARPEAPDPARCGPLPPTRQDREHVAWSKDWHRIETRYDRCPVLFLSACALAATVIYWS